MFKFVPLMNSGGIGLNLSYIGGSEPYWIFGLPHPIPPNLLGLPLVQADAGHKKSALTGRKFSLCNSSALSLRPPGAAVKQDCEAAGSNQIEPRRASIDHTPSVARLGAGHQTDPLPGISESER